MGVRGSTESEYFEFGTDSLKRFVQWILGCTYAKKTIRTRIAEMFHFAEAPHIIVYEQKEEHPWWWTVGVILAVLVAVLSLYYSVETAYRALRKFWLAVLREPQSTVSTPRCLSPVKDSAKNSPPQTVPSTSSIAVRQKIRMNEPVNCVFIRPISPRAPEESPKNSPKQSIMAKNSADDDVDVDASPQVNDKKKISPPPPRLDEVKFDATSNINCRPTMASSPFSPVVPTPTPSNRKMSGADAKEDVSSSYSENDHLGDWIAKQIAGCQLLDSERSMAGAEVAESTRELLEPQITSDFMGLIQEAIESHLNAVGTDTDSNENVSEMSMVTESTLPSLTEVPLMASPVEETIEEESAESSLSMGQETVGGEEEADIVIDENHLFAENENQTDGNVLVSGGQQKVLFRWTDERPATVDSVTLTGSFFGWKMNVPMRRSGENTFEVCVKLPEGMHEYLIHVFRFD